MKKYSYDKNNVLWDELQGDYYAPCLSLNTMLKLFALSFGEKDALLINGFSTSIIYIPILL